MLYQLAISATGFWGPACLMAGYCVIGWWWWSCDEPGWPPGSEPTSLSIAAPAPDSDNDIYTARMRAARDDLIVTRWTLGRGSDTRSHKYRGDISTSHIGSAALAPVPQAAHSQSLICSKASWLRAQGVKVSFGLWKERSHLSEHSYKLSSVSMTRAPEACGQNNNEKELKE